MAVIYIDYHATTPPDPRVVEAMKPCFEKAFGNPASSGYARGQAAAKAVEVARKQVAMAVGADPREVHFTSGATEANNLALKGAFRFRKAHHGRNKLVTLASEHKSVLESLAALKNEGADLVVLETDAKGFCSPERLDKELDERCALISLSLANNEIGVLHDPAPTADLCRKRGVWFHSDGAQALAKIPVDFEASGLDLLSLSSHKAYGPMGMGALIVRRRPRVRLTPLMEGGGQERGVRPGTLPLPLIVGFGKACEIAMNETDTERQRLLNFRKRLLGALQGINSVLINGDLERRLAGNLNLCFPGKTDEDLAKALKGFAYSTGSACSSGSKGPSHVLRALGRNENSGAVLRIGLGRFTSEEEVEALAKALAAL